MGSGPAPREHPRVVPGDRVVHRGGQPSRHHDRRRPGDPRGDPEPTTTTLRHFAYRITAPQYAFHLGVIDVIAIAPKDSLCVYSTTALPDTLALLIAGGTVGALNEIQRLAEASRVAS